MEVQYFIKGKENAIYSSSITGSTENIENLLNDIIRLVMEDMNKKMVLK